MPKLFSPPKEIDALVYAIQVPAKAPGIIVYFDYVDIENPPKPTSPLKMGDKVIDVSKWQGKIDWNKLVLVGGVKKAIIRASYGGTIDPLFSENWANSKAAGIETRIAYHYWQNETNPQIQIDTFLSAIGNDVTDLDYMLDIEDKDPPINENEFNEMYNWFETMYTVTGREGALYTGQSVYNWDIAPDWVFQKVLMKAQYTNGKCTPMSKWGYPEIWQFTSKGKLPGIPDNTVDMSIVWDGETEPIRDWWFRGCYSEVKNDAGIYPPNFFIKENVDGLLAIYDKPHGNIIYNKNITWTMEVKMITMDGWLLVHNDGVNDWWVRQEDTKLA